MSLRRAIALSSLLLTLSVPVIAREGPSPTTEPSTQPSTRPVEPKPLSENVNKGLEWLVKHQLDSGGWGQGEESQSMGGGEALRDVANVADTCAATLALMRAGSSPSSGPHAQNICKAIGFVCTEVENADSTTLAVTKVTGTRLQSKLGPNIDTFITALTLAEVRNAMPDDEQALRVNKALDKVLEKIRLNQKEDGSFVGGGWAPVLSQAVCAKAINRAAQNGAKVDEQVRERAEQYARGQYDEKSKSFGGGGSAGVPLYTASANLGAMYDSDVTNGQMEAKLRATVASTAATQPEREAAQQKLVAIEGNRAEMDDARKVVVDQLQSKQFVNGFGSNGGEEFLSYMNIGETLLAHGGEAWEKWDKSTTENLNRIQNPDGSWSGQHCITGRTFCTSAAVMTLTVDRSKTPLAGEMRAKK